MKIQCNACEVAEASVMCCADEAALCWACDGKIHSANKLSRQHQRVPLSTYSSSPKPKCDICQDRALLCRKCDAAVHTANSFMSTHQRFLLTGVKVLQPCVSSSNDELHSAGKASGKVPPRTAKRSAIASFTGGSRGVLRGRFVADRNLTTNKAALPADGDASEWHIHEHPGLGYGRYYL